MTGLGVLIGIVTNYPRTRQQDSNKKGKRREEKEKRKKEAYTKHLQHNEILPGVSNREHPRILLIGHQNMKWYRVLQAP